MAIHSKGFHKVINGELIQTNPVVLVPVVKHCLLLAREYNYTAEKDSFPLKREDKLVFKCLILSKTIHIVHKTCSNPVPIGKL